MKLINTDGMAFLGPGSEWFWTALSGIILAVTFLAIYRQLRLQRSAGAIEQLERVEAEYASERLTRYQLELLRALRDGVDPADLPRQAAVQITNYWERIGWLARQGHLDRELLWDAGSGFACQGDWVLLSASIQQGRLEIGNPKLAEHFEWLAAEMTERARRAGVPPSNAATQAARRHLAIAACEDLIRVEQSLRAVVVVAPEVVPAVPPATVAGTD